MRYYNLSAAPLHLPAVAIRRDQVRAIREFYTMDLPIVRHSEETGVSTRWAFLGSPPPRSAFHVRTNCICSCLWGNSLLQCWYPSPLIQFVSVPPRRFSGV